MAQRKIKLLPSLVQHTRTYIIAMNFFNVVELLRKTSYKSRRPPIDDH